MRVSSSDVGLLVARAALGVVFFYHGSQKLFGWFSGPGIDGVTQFFANVGIPLPHASAWAASLTETFGGLALLLGLGTRIVSVPLAFTMAVAVSVLAGNGFSAQAGGFEYPLTLGLILITLALTGGGRIGLDPLVEPALARLLPTRRGSPERTTHPTAPAGTPATR